MRIFALSDLHVEYDENARWLSAISAFDFRDDILILAGDLANSLNRLRWCFEILTRRFGRVLFVPGNHDLWVAHESPDKTSFDKFDEVAEIVQSSGASKRPHRERDIWIVPLFGWYDYSFAQPDEELKAAWMDYYACRWPDGTELRHVADHFEALNQAAMPVDSRVITFSHFLPRIDLVPAVATTRLLAPVLGAERLDAQLRKLNSSMHVYGHSHINCRIDFDGVTYINNALGYPRETRYAKRRLVCIREF